MKKSRTYFLLILLIFILVLAVGMTCSECLAYLTGTVRAVGKQTQDILDPSKSKPDVIEREVTWVDVDEEEDPIDEKEETGSSQSENVDDLTKYIEGSISLKGKVHSDIPGYMELTIDGDTNTVSGIITGMGWTEEVLTGDDGDGSEDHHHTRDCVVIFNGTFFGTIDAGGNIFANVTGSKNGAAGECKQLVKDKPESFTLQGNHNKVLKNAGGTITQQGYLWTADKI